MLGKVMVVATVEPESVLEHREVIGLEGSRDVLSWLDRLMNPLTVRGAAGRN